MISHQAAVRMSQLITTEAKRPRDCSPWAVIASRCVGLFLHREPDASKPLQVQGWYRHTGMIFNGKLTGNPFRGRNPARSAENQTGAGQPTMGG
jgi:hypothetical protein